MKNRVTITMSQAQIHQNLHHISENFKGILLDAWGVFWGGNDMGILPGTKETMEELVSRGKTVGILSNSTQLAAKEIHKFNLHGLVEKKHFHFLITSGDLTRSIFLNQKLPFRTPHKKFWLFGRLHPRFSSHEAIFQDTLYSETVEIEKADFIYINIPHIHGEDQENPEVFHDEIKLLKRKDLPMVCPNPDRFAHEDKPPKAVVRQGGIAALYEKMGGRVYYIGKPYMNAYSRAMEYFHQKQIFDPREVLMIGDNPETDIRGARNFGMAAALVTKTGIMADRISEQGWPHAIHHLLPSDYPDFFMEKL